LSDRGHVVDIHTELVHPFQSPKAAVYRSDGPAHAGGPRAGVWSIAGAGKLAALRGQTTIEELMQTVVEVWPGTPGT